MILIVLFCSGFATSLFSFIYLHLCDILYATILLNKHIYIYNITTLTANYLQMKMSINFVVYILYNMSPENTVCQCSIAPLTNVCLLDAAGVLDNSHNSAHNLVCL